ncbi:TPA: hypothetical protein ACX6NV_003892 [Photobacterium damselae]
MNDKSLIERSDYLLSHYIGLFQRRVVVIVSTVLVCLIMAIIYVSLSSSLWKSDAIIITPDYGQMSKLRNKVSLVYGYDAETKAILDKFLSEEKIFSLYMTIYNSYNNKKDFIEKSDDIKKENQDFTSEKSISFFNKWNKRISSSSLDSKNNNIYKLSFISSEPEKSQKLLQSYIVFTNDKVSEKIQDNIISLINKKKIQINSEYVRLQNEALGLLEIEKEKTKYSLEIAAASTVEKPILMMNNKNLFSIELGVNGLREQEKILSEIKNLSIIAPELVVIKSKLMQLDNIKTDSFNNINLVNYDQSPALPINKEGLSSVIIIIISIIFGLLLGMGIAIIVDTLKNKAIK